MEVASKARAVKQAREKVPQDAFVILGASISSSYGFHRCNLIPRQMATWRVQRALIQSTEAKHRGIKCKVDETSATDGQSDNEQLAFNYYSLANKIQTSTEGIEELGLHF